MKMTAKEIELMTQASCVASGSMMHLVTDLGKESAPAKKDEFYGPSITKLVKNFTPSSTYNAIPELQGDTISAMALKAWDIFSADHKKLLSDYLTANFYQDVYSYTYRRRARKDFNDPRYKMSERDVFRAAFALIEKEENWCQGSLFKHEKHVVREYRVGEIEPISAENTMTTLSVEDELQDHKRMCSIGALNEANGFPDGARNRMEWSQYPGAQVEARLEQVMGMNVAQFNDSHTHTEVVNAWRICGQQNGWL